MLSLTRKADYALVAMADLAQRGASRTSARELAATTHVPLPVLTNILHQLLHRGLVSSVMGSKGGYQIARPPDRIPLAEIIDAIEGRFKLALCCGETGTELEADCDLEDACQIKAPLRKVNHGLRHYLSQISLAQIAFDDAPIGITLPPGSRDTGKEPAVTAD